MYIIIELFANLLILVLMDTVDRIARMLGKQPSIVSYKSLDDLMVLKDWFYNFNDDRDQRVQAVEKVKALSARGKVPHAIECTSLLTSICISDPNFHSKASTTFIQKDSNILQLSYSMALTRFVNGLLDPLQQSNYAIPLHQLAKGLGVPSFFVELRHMATHERLPSLDMLRIATTNALNWLYDNYWNRINDLDLDDVDEDSDSLTTKDQITIQEQIRSRKEQMIDLIASLRTYKKIRKQDLNYVYKFGNSTENGIKYWKAVQSIRKQLVNNKELVWDTLTIKDFIIYNDETKSKKITSYLNLLFKLYGPLFNEFGNTFKYEFILYLLKTLSEELDPIELQVKSKLNLLFSTDFQKDQAARWIMHLTEEIISAKENTPGIPKNPDDLLQTVYTRSTGLGNSQKLIVFKGLVGLSPKPSKLNLDSLIKAIEKEESLKKYQQAESLDSILGASSSPEPQSKKRKIEPEQQSNFIFEPHADWEPVPFGSIV